MSASGPGDRVVSTRDVAVYFRADCRPLSDSLQLEMVVAQYCLRMADVVTTAGPAAGDVVGPEVVAELEGHGDSLSHAILRGLAHLEPGETGVRAAESAARLEDRAVGLPERFADVGNASPVGVWRTGRGGRGGEFALFAEFEHPRGRRHTIALFVEPCGGGRVKHIGLLGPIGEFDREDPFHPNAMEALEIAPAAALMRDVLERSYGVTVAANDDYRVLIASARARAIIAGGAVSPDVRGGP
jgi:hypothetical protein